MASAASAPAAMERQSVNAAHWMQQLSMFIIPSPLSPRTYESDGRDEFVETRE